MLHEARGRDLGGDRGFATAEQSSLLASDKRPRTRRTLERLLDEAEDRYDEVKAVTRSERDQVLPTSRPNSTR